MPRRFANIPRQRRAPHEVEIQGFWNVYVIAIGIAILLGLVGGGLWIAWRLLFARFVD
jgi:hypothetical protein